MKLENRVAIVSGGAQGIGRAIVEEFLKEGARVFAIDVNAERLHSTASEINSDRFAVGVGDLTSEPDIERLVKEAVATFGPVEILAANAGVTDNQVQTLDYSLDLWNKLFAVNVTSQFLLAKAVIPGMLEMGKGAIVNTSSASGLIAGGGGIGYTASKHAVIGLTRQLAFEFGSKGIRVNAFLPGPTRTPMLESALSNDVGGHIKAFIESIPAQRPMEAVEGARAVAFLASDDASFMHGSPLISDGGWTIA
jgi:NAD(P)-dependent dehydrogenase (short-subunit alcohol dehydrogenase family)